MNKSGETSYKEKGIAPLEEGEKGPRTVARFMRPHPWPPLAIHAKGGRRKLALALRPATKRRCV